MRLTIIDGFRGVFLVFMLVIHANGPLNTVLGKLNHHYFGWVEDAQGFVFMSGLVIGLVYGGRYLSKNYHVMHKAIWARIRTIYSHQIALILIFLLSAIAFKIFAVSVPTVLEPYTSQPLLFTTFAALLVTGSKHMGILPMYIFFMMATPFALKLIKQERSAVYATLIVAMWAIAQTRLSDQLVIIAERMLVEAGHEINLGIFFNILGWQALFFGGVWIGFQMAAKKLNTAFLMRSEMRIVFFHCFWPVHIFRHL